MFCRVGLPSHIGIKGNERAESVYKCALELPDAKVGVPYSDLNIV